MWPTFRSGDHVLVDPRAYERFEPQVGELTLIQHPFRKSVRMIKRVDRRTASGRFFVLGDNAVESTDSRSFGALPRARFLGKVVCKL